MESCKECKYLTMFGNNETLYCGKKLKPLGVDPASGNYIYGIDGYDRPSNS